MIPVLLGVSFLVLTILSLTPGDPGSIILGITAKPEDIASLVGFYLERRKSSFVIDEVRIHRTGKAPF